MNDPWAWTTGWGLTVGVKVIMKSNRGENEDNCNRTTIKYSIRNTKIYKDLWIHLTKICKIYKPKTSKHFCEKKLKMM